MAAPVSFRERSDSFPLHRGRRPYMALTAIRYAAQNSVAIGGTADITGLGAVGGSIENDPLRKSGGPKCCAAQRGLFNDVLGCDRRVKEST
jgi:hypothetical protein